MGLASRQVKLFGEICNGVGGIRVVQIVAHKTQPALFRKLRHGCALVFRPRHFRVGKMRIIVVTGRALVTLVAQSRFQQKKIARLEMVKSSVFPQIHVPVADDIQNILVDRP